MYLDNKEDPESQQKPSLTLKLVTESATIAVATMPLGKFAPENDSGHGRHLISDDATPLESSFVDIARQLGFHDSKLMFEESEQLTRGWLNTIS